MKSDMAKIWHLFGRARNWASRCALGGLMLLSALLFAPVSAALENHPHSEFLGQNVVSVALVQLDSSEVGSISAIEQHVQTAQSKGAVVVVFPEASIFGWLNPVVFSSAQDVPGSIFDQLAAIANQYDVYLAIGMAQAGPSAGDGFNYAYDAGILIGPDGSLLLNTLKSNVLQNAFEASDCPTEVLNSSGGCNYESGDVASIQVVDTPLGKTALLVCADAYASSYTAALDQAKALGAETILVVWGVAAGQENQCGATYYNAAEYASDAAEYADAMVIGANAVGGRPYGRFLPSYYCGYSGISDSNGTIIAQTDDTSGVFVFDVTVN